MLLLVEKILVVEKHLSPTKSEGMPSESEIRDSVIAGEYDYG